MSARVQELAWDSEHWGRRTGTVVCTLQDAPSVYADALRAARTELDFAQTLVPVGAIEHAQAAEDLGYRLVDVRCVVALDPIRRSGWAEPAGAVRPVADGHVAAVGDLAAGCHTASRFALDRRLDPQRVQDLYRRWILRDAATPDRYVGIVGPDAAPTGYVTYAVSGRGVGTIGLIGVRDGARRSGVGRRLLDHAIERCAAAGAVRMEVVTQAGNAAALGMYRAAGFTIEQLALWMHWHREAGPAG